MGYIGIILGLYWGYIGIMENKMETTGFRAKLQAQRERGGVNPKP